MKFVCLLLFAAGLSAQVVPDQYIVEFDGEPAARVVQDRDLTVLRLDRLRRQQRAAREAIERRQARVITTVERVANAMVVEAPGAEAADLAALPGVRRVHPVRLMQLRLDRALPIHQVPQAWALAGGEQAAGAGVKIGIIDTGIDASHPAFRDPSLSAPDGFPKVNQESDRQFTNGKVIVARAYTSSNRLGTGSATDLRGHGTAVAMAAAGVTNTGPLATITGVAPKAWLGNYKVFSDGGSGAPDSLILKALDDALADGMDVVNLSLGSLLAAPLESDILVQAVERASAAGMIVVIAAGNDGPDLNTIGSPGTAPSAITVGNSSSDRMFGATALVGGVAYLAIPGSGTPPGQAPTGLLADAGLACDPLPPQSLSARIALVLRGVCTFETKLGNVMTAGGIAALVYTDSEHPEPIAMDVGQAIIPAEMIGYQDGVAIKARLDGGEALTASLQFARGPVPVDSGRLAASSSRGPGIGGAIKPELLAVGNPLYTAAPMNGYTVVSGTSLSTPLITGAAAVLKAARPGLTAAQYRSLLVNSATPLGGRLDSPVQQTGAGVMNLASALQVTAAASPASLSFGSGGGTVEQSREIEVTNAGRNADTFTLTAVATRGGLAPELREASVSLGPGESMRVAVRLRADSLPAGSYEGFIRIQGNSGAPESRVPYWYGVQSSEPRYVTLVDVPDTGRRSARAVAILRVTDASGIPVLDSPPAVSVTGGGGSVEGVESADSEIPGTWAVIVRLGPAAGSNEFRIEAGSVTRSFSVRAF